MKNVVFFDRKDIENILMSKIYVFCNVYVSFWFIIIFFIKYDMNYGNKSNVFCFK